MERAHVALRTRQKQTATLAARFTQGLDAARTTLQGDLQALDATTEESKRHRRRSPTLSSLVADGPTCKIFHAPSQGYRISDIAASRFFRHSPGGMVFHRMQFPQSLASSFLKEYHKGTPRWNKYYENTSCVSRLPGGFCSKAGLCQCFVPPAAAIFDLIAREEHQRMRKGSGRLKKNARIGSMNQTAAVHLRVGDVVDKSPFTLDQMLDRPTKFRSYCTQDQQKAGCNFQTRVNKKMYVLPFSAYGPVVQRLGMLGIKQVVIVANAHANLTSYAKSCELIRRVGYYFQRANFSVSYRLGEPPDEDLRFVARCAAVVPTGASGFGMLMSKVAEFNGATLAMPSGLWERNRFDLDLWGQDAGSLQRDAPRMERQRALLREDSGVRRQSKPSA